MSGPTDLGDRADPTQPARPELSLGDVVGKLGDDLSALLSTQVEIAKIEIKQEVSKAARGAGLITSGAVAALVGVLMLSMAAAWGIAEALDPWSGFLIVGAAWVVIAGVLAFSGKRQLGAVNATPQQTLDELRADQQLARRLPD